MALPHPLAIVLILALKAQTFSQAAQICSENYIKSFRGKSFLLFNIVVVVSLDGVKKDIKQQQLNGCEKSKGKEMCCVHAINNAALDLLTVDGAI
jgi:hypothetical protein